MRRKQLMKYIPLAQPPGGLYTVGHEYVIMTTLPLQVKVVRIVVPIAIVPVESTAVICTVARLSIVSSWPRFSKQLNLPT